ncbi:arsenic resistance N-acetyltransferase ArsN2 [Massilia endophytica]|uniref:arsenic resistance N-acetyltransferase ArsN2 n=1 Tax=Massilia endophytica TaxID=2899220 RepID=UPI001E5D1377|nr:arsenic resistance N-acetyltransferase ArsN2 [Massilia endophytica]UGQ48583.1 arsenic resistance N-acetyltransferase ArsN2 [Massilia endophytica]
MTTTLTFRPATQADWPAIQRLLQAAQLPTDGASDHLDAFIVGDTGTELLCAGGLELYGQAALLRSVVVAAQHQGQGLGDQLHRQIAELARTRRIDTLYLLTTTAAQYFARRGFQEVDRASVPSALQASREFQGACPASATLMACSL